MNRTGIGWIFHLGVVDILDNAQKVCSAWRKICKDPALWRVIKMHILSSHEEQMCKQAVDRSQGQLVDLSIRSSSTHDELLSYIADRLGQLRRLELVSFEVDVLKIPLMKFPYLEELNFYSCRASMMTKEFIETAVRYCPMLKTFKVNHGLINIGDLDDQIAIAIGKNLHQLRHLELFGSDMSNEQLEVILDGCRHLETLDLRNCVSIDLNGDLGKRCFEQIKTLKLPDDSFEGSPYRDVYDEDLVMLAPNNFCLVVYVLLMENVPRNEKVSSNYSMEENKFVLTTPEFFTNKVFKSREELGKGRGIFCWCCHCHQKIEQLS
uniref:putative F-box/LRR-repeat protein 23 n=1 Tax=Erigeron canadensis TaxID=72917 RepID=UPI001CB963EE|nr:putative F-box/LRR-repeat protein 23 [Erigeron canadensis]